MWLTIPNLFTMIRVAMTPFILMALARGDFLLGGWLFGAAALTDLLDGAIARRFGGETRLGLYLDPIADKILLSSIYIGLAAGKAIGWWLVAVIFGRDFWILLLSAIALRFTSFRNLEPSVWGKASTFLQVMTAIALMAGYGYRDAVLLKICAGLVAAVVTFACVSAGEYSLRGVAWLRGRTKPLTCRSTGSTLKGSRTWKMSRYVPARHYVSFGVVALALAAFSVWLGVSLAWTPAYCPALLFFLTAALLLGLALRPTIKVFDSHLELGKRIIPWQDVRRIDRTGWISPLVVRLTLYDDESVTLIYPGEVDCCKHLLRTMRQLASSAMIDGVPYRQYWGELLGHNEAKQLAAPRYRVLRREDEEEVERLYFLLKTVGNIDPRNSGDER